MGSRCLSATGIRFSVIRCPPRSWALLTVGLPDQGPDLDGVTAFRTHELRPVRVPSIPRGRRCSPRTEDRAQPAPAASQRQRPIPPAPTFHLPRFRLTRHQRGFKQFTRPVFPSPATTRMERAAASAFPRASHPADQEPDDARQGWGQAIEHEPGQRSRHQPNLQSCVLAHGVRPRVAPIEATLPRRA